MMGILKNGILAALALVAMAVSPAFGKDDTTYATLHASEPPLAAGMARIYFYRENGLMGVAVQPHIFIDGVSTGGRSKPGDYFYVDKPAGTYVISTETEKEEDVTLTIAAGESKYVRTDVTMGFMIGHVIPSIIDPQQATLEIADCDYREPSPPEGAAAVAAPAPPSTAPTTPTAPTTVSPPSSTAASPPAADATPVTSSATPAAPGSPTDQTASTPPPATTPAVAPASPAAPVPTAAPSDVSATAPAPAQPAAPSGAN